MQIKYVDVGERLVGKVVIAERHFLDLGTAVTEYNGFLCAPVRKVLPGSRSSHFFILKASSSDTRTGYNAGWCRPKGLSFCLGLHFGCQSSVYCQKAYLGRTTKCSCQVSSEPEGWIFQSVLTPGSGSSSQYDPFLNV